MQTCCLESRVPVFLWEVRKSYLTHESFEFEFEIAVTELVVKAFPKPTSIFSGFLIFPMSQFSTISSNFIATTNNNTNPDVSLLLATLQLSGQPVILVFPIVFGDEATAKAQLPWIWQLEGAIMDTTASVNWEELQSLQCISCFISCDGYYSYVL